MARTVSNFTFASRSANRIDFSPWSDGQIWQLVEGEDFQLEAKKVAGKARTWAKNNSKAVQISVSQTDDGKPCVYVKFSPLESSAAPAPAATQPAATPPADKPAEKAKSPRKRR